MEVFLGDTCADSRWRERLTPILEMGFFNPVVPDWTEECYQLELWKREHCDFTLYVITPAMIGVYSIAEVIDDSNKRPQKVIFCYLPKDEGKEFNEQQIKSLSKVAEMVVRNGGKYCETLADIADYLNGIENSQE